MANKASGSRKAEKSAADTPTVKKTAGKKKAGKKAVSKKALKKITLKKKAVKKRATKKKEARKSRTAPGKMKTKTGIMTPFEPKTAFVEPGPPPAGIPPVEEPVENEEAIGTITHYYSNLGVAIVQINKGKLKTGDIIHIKGHKTDFSQRVESMEYEHSHADEAAAGQSIGVKVMNHTREHDIVYRVK